MSQSTKKKPATNGKKNPKTDEETEPTAEQQGPPVEDSAQDTPPNPADDMPAIPMRDSPGHIPRHVDLQLSRDQGVCLKALREGLIAEECKLQSGKPVWTNNDALRWLFENMRQFLKYENV